MKARDVGHRARDARTCPPANGAFSKRPIGPFQKIVFASAKRLAKASTLFGPDVERHRARRGRASTLDGLARRVGLDARGDDDVDRQQRRRRPWPRAFSRMRARERQLVALDAARPACSCPCAARNVFAIAPPMTSAFTFSSSDSTTAILSLTFAPPRTATYGFSGAVDDLARARRSPSRGGTRSRARDRASRGRGRSRARGARRRTRRRRTRRRARASSRQKPSSSFSSSGWKRRFSSRHTWPARRS